LSQTIAEVRAEEARKRRRLALALAVANVLLLSGAGAAGWWYQYQLSEREAEETRRQAAAQQRRLAEAQQGIEAALAEASKLRAVGLQQVDNLSAWGATLAAARTALQHALTLLSQEPELAETGLAKQAQQVQAQLEADTKDWKLLAVYDQVRLEQSQWDLARRRFKLAESYSRLQQALADYGLAIGSLEPGQAAARLRQRPGALQMHLRAVLEECLAWVPEKAVEQRQWLAAVLAIDADPWLVQFRKAVAKGAWAEVEKLAGQAKVSRYHPAVLLGLARNLPEEARASKVLLLRRTQQQYPGDFWVNLELGAALYWSVFPTGEDRPARVEKLPLVSEAVAFYRVAVGLRPGNAPALNNLGQALKAQGDFKRAVACYQKALDLDPKFALAHTNLGNALYAQGDVQAAVACFRKALDLDPKDAKAHNSLGSALLYATRDVAGAIPYFTKALELDPKYARAHYNLGNALKSKKDLRAAIACYQKAIALDPELAPAHRNLGVVLLLSGRLTEAQPAIKSALVLLPPFEQPLARYRAACAAVRAAAGKADADKLTDKEKTGLREQALAWLRDNLKHYTGQLKELDAAKQAEVQALHYWQQDPDLASVRGEKTLAQLPEPERAAWQQLWTEVEKLLQKVGPPLPFSRFHWYESR
jgi:tetratricopeptide (TPR) repeat protein